MCHCIRKNTSMPLKRASYNIIQNSYGFLMSWQRSYFLVSFITFSRGGWSLKRILNAARFLWLELMRRPLRAAVTGVCRDRIRKGFAYEARVIARVLPAFLADFFPPENIMNKVISELLSSQQPHPQVMATVVFQVRRRPPLAGSNATRTKLNLIFFVFLFFLALIWPLCKVHANICCFPAYEKNTCHLPTVNRYSVNTTLGRCCLWWNGS